MKTYCIDGTDLTFKADEYCKACEIVNSLDTAISAWAKKHKINTKNIKTDSITKELFNMELGFEEINPKTKRIIPEDAP